MIPESDSDVLANLLQRLEAVFGLKIYDGLEVEAIDRLLHRKPPSVGKDDAPPCVLPSVRLRVGSHFDVEPDLFIHADAMGTFGLVYRLDAPLVGSGDIEERVHELLSQAAYLHYLLRSDPERGQHLVRNVELVLLTCGDKDVPLAVERALTELAQTTDFLFEVGVYLLSPDTDEGDATAHFPEALLRRAFPWLLSATVSWYDQVVHDRAANGDEGPADRRLDALCMTDFRIAGERNLSFPKKERQRRLILLHGRNGTGKSSIAEALEWALTGRIERLPADEDVKLKSVVTYAGARTVGDSARVKLRFADGSKLGFDTAAEANPFLCTDLVPQSFRLDQGLMERLSQADESKRAKVFLEGYFPEKRDLYLEGVQARSVFKGVWDSLPTPTQAYLDRHGKTSADLSPYDPDSDVPGFSSLAACMPDDAKTLLTLAEMDTLARFDPGLRALLEREHTESVGPILEHLSELDAAVGRLRSTAAETRQHIELARTTIEGFKGWSLEAGAAPAGKPAQVLNDWLEASVLAQMARQRLKLATVLVEAGERTARLRRGPDTIAKAITLGQSDRQALAVFRTRVEAERDDLLKAFYAVRDAESETPGDASRQPARLRREQVQVLNRIGDWLIPDGVGAARLGDALYDACTRHAPDAVFADIPIGRRGWFSELEPRLRELEGAAGVLARLVAGAGEGVVSCQTRYQRIAELRSTLVRQEQADRDISDSFLRQIGLISGQSKSGATLNAALNELMALFTSASWTYEDIRISYEAKAGKKKPQENVHLTIRDDVRAELRLNTAELNLFTVALFLLCAPRVANPLRLLILDDPLQNMDELTSLTLARGMARLFRLWSRFPGWRVLVMFHGEDDMLRFRHNLPAEAYELEWLKAGVQISPSGEGPNLVDCYQPLSRDLIRALAPTGQVE